MRSIQIIDIRVKKFWIDLKIRSTKNYTPYNKRFYGILIETYNFSPNFRLQFLFYKLSIDLSITIHNY